MTISPPAARHDVGVRRRLRVRRLGAGLVVAGCCGLVCAEPDGDPGTAKLQWSGFGTLGVVHLDAPAGTGFERDIGERANDGGTRADIDTRLGVQANFRASPQVEFVGQLVAADRVPTARTSDIVTMAFGAWRPRDDVTVRAGRMSTDYYLLADYRHVGFAYPFVRPPVENYGTVPYFVDGIDLTKAWNPGDAVWKLRGVAGRSELAHNKANAPLGLRPVYALVLSRDDGEGLLVKSSVSRVRLHADPTAVKPLIDALGTIASLPEATVAAGARALAAALDYDNRPATYYSLGVGLDRGAWIGSIEVSRCEPQRASSYTSGWTLVGHRWGTVTAYAGASAIRSDPSRSPPDWTAALTPLVGSAAAAQAQQLGTIARSAAAQTIANQRTLTLGLRWDFADRMALKLQWDRVRVDAYANRYWTTPRPDEPIHANVGSATLDFVF